MTDRQHEWPATPPDLAAVKQQAFDLKRATGCVHGHALEQIARNLGYGTYAALLEHHKRVGRGET